MEADHDDTVAPAQSGKTQSPSIVRRFLQLIGVAARTGDSNERSQFRNNVGDLSHFDRLKAELAKQRDEQRGEPGLAKTSEFENPAPPAVNRELNNNQSASGLVTQSIPESDAEPVPVPPPEPNLEHSVEPLSEPVFEPIDVATPEPAIETDSLILPEPIQTEEPDPNAESIAKTAESNPEPAPETIAPPKIEATQYGIDAARASPQAAEVIDSIDSASQLDEALEEFERKRQEIRQALNQPD